MHIKVIFGSESDQYIYEELVAKISEQDNLSCDFEVISAHRNLEKLKSYLTNETYDCVIAGAGLAAHLPGVCAAITKKPVIGIPVEANFGGIDAFASILQMPFGVPVLCSYPSDFDSIISFLNSLKTDMNYDLVSYSINPKKSSMEYVNLELERFKKYANEVKIDVVENATDEKIVNLNFFNEISDVVPTKGLNINVPLFDNVSKKEPLNMFKVFEMAKKEKGLWIGTNNSRNALALIERLREV